MKEITRNTKRKALGELTKQEKGGRKYVKRVKVRLEGRVIVG